MRRSIIAALLLATAPLTIPPPAHALFGIGDIVIDPSNLAQNVLTATRSLQQINNQIRQLQNEAAMLRHQADNLTRLDVDVSQDLRQIMAEIAALSRQANAISYQVEETERLFKTHYPREYADWSRTDMVEAAAWQWDMSRAAYQDTLVMQSRIVEAVERDADVLEQLMEASGSATGNLSVAQAGNQLTALSIKQDMQIQQLMAAQYRADALERARRLQIERESQARQQRFMAGADAAYARP